MPPKKKQRLPVLPGQKTLFSFVAVGRDRNNNCDHDDTENMIGSQEVQVESDSEPDNDDTLDHGPSDRDANVSNDKDVRKYRPVWEKMWPWLTFDGTKMYCKLCKETGKRNAMALGCTSFKTSTMTRHEDTSDHKLSVAAPAGRQDFKDSCKKLFSNEDEAVMIAMMAVYWLASEDLPLNKYESMIQFLKNVGVSKLENLRVNDHVHYESYYSAKEILSAINDEIEAEIDEKIAKSPFVTILADESTDISNHKKMTINARIVDPDTSVPETVFLRDLSYTDGSGEGLAGIIIDEMSRHNIANHKLIGFGSDGATVMSGSDKGVKGRLMEINPHLIHVHCMAHRLALCTSQAADGISQMKNYQEWLTSVFYYFKASPTRESELHEVQQVLNLPILKCKEIHAVRWLSCFQAVSAVYRSLDALISYFHKRQASKDPKAKGLLKKMATTSFIYITYLLMDVLPIVPKLCLTLQKQDLDIAVAKICLDRCKTDLNKYKENTQMFPTHLEKFDTDVKVGESCEFKGHLLSKSPCNLNAIRSSFVNKLLDNISKRFPQEGLMNNFFALAMRTLNMEDAESIGNTEIHALMDHFGEEKEHKGKVSPPKLERATVLKEWSDAKTIVKSLKYPVDRMKNLWQLLTQHHKEEIPNLIKLAQISLIIPLHTADCERTFSIQNQIVTPKRNRLDQEQCDKLIRIKVHGKGLDKHNFKSSLERWHGRKKRILKSR